MNRKILVVDDDELLAEGIKMILEMEGFEVEMAMGVSQAINYLNTEIPGMAVIDMMLTDGTGDGLIKLMRGDERTKSLPLLMISASREVEEKARVAGADWFLAKPFDLEELVSLVRECLN